MSAVLRPVPAAPRPPRHLLSLRDHDRATLRGILTLAAEFKRGRRAAPLDGRTIALLFEQPSTRTRVSFHVAVHQLGGDTITLSAAELQASRGESVADTARVLSRYVDGIVLRTRDHARLLELAAHATVPVVNGLSDIAHPCQLLADVMTFEEHRGPIAGQTVAWSGDCNNMARTWIEAAALFGFALNLAMPESRRPPDELLAWARGTGARIALTADPAEAARGARAVVTDCWVSMADADAAGRHALLEPYRVTPALMARGAPDAIFLHCLPAHRGEEVSAEVIDGPCSVVFDEAENRLHAQKGVLAWLFED